MSTLQIQLDEELMERLRVAAEAQAVSLEVLAQAALESYVQPQLRTEKQYSFIGIGRSGKRDLSRRVENILSAGANRREGWSLQE
ncbi:hypothetical protein BN873_200012 [Candidatus Competibacter denitrificans Run_A_D11]|uniref:Uncharacterized protein n=1 Tax=Candidatus Competibacter denitrificans Run_A_D11 TaxID=1400863 RepID=W6M560_9GAMM|nr:hypothetical protein [Candidatus Competibacter denitrificans]CDI01769.1 hypothetical protein BN873_200012 [Candidatus Competibacter denitrificans Run_A_D11]HAS85686.1 hypothetical protein [Candidatus Competibacteraceae bacterium]HRC70570.1 hypothetical protein [Candidatus Competibacter denitrificans]